jgi:hypothetical protein
MSINLVSPERHLIPIAASAAMDGERHIELARNSFK